VVFGRTAIAMGHRRGLATFYRTTDAEHWRPAGRLDLQGLRFSDFRAPTTRTWWVFGAEGRKPVALVTTDAGRSWRRRHLPGRAGSATLAATAGRAWLTTQPPQGEGEGTLYSSGDLGRTWTRVKP